MDYDFSKLETERKAIEEFLGRPDAFSDPDFAVKSKRAAELSEIFELKSKIESDEEALKDAKSLVTDPDLGDLAKEDVVKFTTLLEKEKADLEEKLIPRDRLTTAPPSWRFAPAPVATKPRFSRVNFTGCTSVSPNAKA